MMIELTQGAGEVVAGDVRVAVAAFDGAILAAMRMGTSYLEATQGAGVPAGQSQRVLRSITAGVSLAVDGRGGIVESIRHMLAIKQASSIAWADYGCPTGLDEPVYDAADRPEPAHA